MFFFFFGGKERLCVSFLAFVWDGMMVDLLSWMSEWFIGTNQGRLLRVPVTCPGKIISRQQK